MQFCLNFETFKNALVESFPDKKNSIQLAFQEFEHRIEEARQELGSNGPTTKAGASLSSVQLGESVSANKQAGKLLPTINEATLAHDRGVVYQSGKGVVNGSKLDKNQHFEVRTNSLPQNSSDQQQQVKLQGRPNTNIKSQDWPKSKGQGGFQSPSGEFKLPSITMVEQSTGVLPAKGSQDTIKGQAGNLTGNCKFNEGTSALGNPKNYKSGNTDAAKGDSKQTSKGALQSNSRGTIVSSVLGLDFRDRVASLPKITELFEKLEEAVCGGRSTQNDGKNLQISSREANNNSQFVRQPLPYSRKKITQWLEFVKEYQRSKETNGALGEYMKKLEQRFISKENELEFRLNEQGYDTNILDSFANNPIKEYDEARAKGLGIHSLEKKGSLAADQNSSTIDDIAGERFQGFKDSCWILLTSQKPTATSSNSKNSKDISKDKTSIISQSSGPNKISQFGLKNNDSVLHGQNRGGDDGGDFALNSLGGTQDSKSRAQHVRASTLEKEPGSTNFSYLQQLQQGAQATMPQRRYGHSSCVINGKMYIFGGHHRSGSGQQAFHSLYECQVKLDSQKEDLFKWKKIQVESPQTRDSHSCVNFHEQILIFGGSSKKSTFNDLYKYNVNQRMWTKLDAIFDDGEQPSPREGHVGIMIDGDKMFVHGGYDKNYSCFSDAFILVGLHKEIDQAQSEIKYDENGNVSNALDLKRRRGQFEMLQWFKCEQEGDVPSGRDSHSAVVLNNQVYIFGGQDSNENLLNDFFVVSIIQTYQKKVIKQKNGQVVEFFDRKFKLNWRQIKFNGPQPSTGLNSSPKIKNWPQKRSSHSMTLYMNRFLVVIGGESPVEPSERESSKNGKESTDKEKGEAVNKTANEKKSGKTEGSDDKESYSSDQDQKTKSMGDVWIFDIVQQYWQEIKPVVKVQQAFNNRKMRKTFDARMAHSANIFGNYIVIFGGYCIQSGLFSHPNFTVLSLLGCTDYMLPKVCTLKQLINEHQVQLDQKLEEERKQQKLKLDKAEQAERDKAEKDKAVRISKKKQPLQSSFRDGHTKNEAILPSISSITQNIPLDRRDTFNGANNGLIDSGAPTQVSQTGQQQRDSQFKMPQSSLWDGGPSLAQNDIQMQVTQNKQIKQIQLNIDHHNRPSCPTQAGSSIFDQGDQQNKSRAAIGHQSQIGAQSSLTGCVSSIQLSTQQVQKRQVAFNQKHELNLNEATHREVCIQVNQNFDRLLIENKVAEDEHRVKKKIQFQACPLDSTLKIANHIRNPLQLMVEVLKMQVDQYKAHFELEEQDSATRIVANQDEFDEMDIAIDLLVEDEDHINSRRFNDTNLNGDASYIRTKCTLQIKDSGPGFSHRQLKQMLQGEKISKKVVSGGPKYIERLELFKYAALRLAEHTMIITRSQIVPDKQLINQVQPVNKLKLEQPICEVHIGMLSSRFIKDSGASRLVAPIVTFRLQPRVKNENEIEKNQAGVNAKSKKAAENHFSVTKEFELVPLSPMSDKFLNLMLSYIRGIFSSVSHLKKHIIKNSFIEKQHHADTPDSTVEGINFNESLSNQGAQKYKRAVFATGTEFYFCNMKDEFLSPEGQEDDIFLIKEKSLSKQDNVQYMKIKEGLGHSLRLELSYAYIDFPRNVSVKINGLPPVIDNPFRSIIKIVQPEDNVAIRGAKNGMYRYWIVAQSVLTTLLQHDDNASEITSRLEGLLVFYGNEFITRDELSQPQGESIVRGLGKRAHQSNNNSSNEILHGIIMIDQNQSQNILTFDRQSIADRAFMTKLREDIWKSYRKWKKQNESKFFGSQMENLKDFLSVDEAQSVPHKYMKLENAEVELDGTIPIERVRASSTKKANTGNSKLMKNHDQSMSISMNHHNATTNNKKSSKQQNQAGGGKQSSRHNNSHHHHHYDSIHKEAIAQASQQQQQMQLEQAYLSSLDMQHQMSMMPTIPQMAMMQAASHHHQIAGAGGIAHNATDLQQQSHSMLPQQRHGGMAPMMDSADAANFQQHLVNQMVVSQNAPHQQPQPHASRPPPFLYSLSPPMMAPSNFHNPYGGPADMVNGVPGAGLDNRQGGSGIGNRHPGNQY